MPEAPDRYVFVYGTLRRGGRNDINRLAPAPQFVGAGEVRGILHHLGWYPGLTLGGEQAITVVGEVYRITPQLEEVLDRIEEVKPGEDSEYFKRIVPIRVQGEPLECLLYEVNPLRVRDLPRLEHGDWIAFHKA